MRRPGMASDARAVRVGEPKQSSGRWGRGGRGSGAKGLMGGGIRGTAGRFEKIKASDADSGREIRARERRLKRERERE
jgi:hypothetical protein